MRRAAGASLPICLVLAWCAGASVGTSQELDVCAEARGCLNQLPLIASVPPATRNSSGHGSSQADATSPEKPTNLAALDLDEPAAGLSSGHSWRQWPSLTDF